MGEGVYEGHSGGGCYQAGMTDIAVDCPILWSPHQHIRDIRQLVHMYFVFVVALCG